MVGNAASKELGTLFIMQEFIFFSVVTLVADGFYAVIVWSTLHISRAEIIKLSPILGISNGGHKHSAKRNRITTVSENRADIATSIGNDRH